MFNFSSNLGFGLPLAIITSYPESQVVSGCGFSILFPLFLISGNQAQVVVTYQDVTMRIFNPTIALSNLIFSRTLAPSPNATWQGLDKHPTYYDMLKYIQNYASKCSSTISPIF